METGIIQKLVQGIEVISPMKTGDTKNYCNIAIFNIYYILGKSGKNPWALIHAIFCIIISVKSFNLWHLKEMLIKQTALDNNKYAKGMFLDILKAFDTLNHASLQSKMYK